MQLQKINRVCVPYISLAGMLLALGGLGYLGFLAFVRNMLMPGEFAAYGLVITAVAAGTASFFALTTGGFLTAFLTLLLFAGTMGSLMLGVSLLVGPLRTYSLSD